MGGLLLHIRIHPPDESAFNWIPVISGVVSLVALTILFNFRSTVAWGYILNLTSVIIGTVTMAFYSATHWARPVTWEAILLDSTLPDILVLFAKIPLGYIILRQFRPVIKKQDTKR